MKQLSLFDYQQEPMSEEEADKRSIERIRAHEEELRRSGPPVRSTYTPRLGPYMPLQLWLEHMAQLHEKYKRQLMEADPTQLPADLYARYCQLWNIAPDLAIAKGSDEQTAS